MLRSLRTLMIGSLYVAIFLSSTDFNQVSARVVDDRGGRPNAGMRNNQSDAYRGGRYNYRRDDGQRSDVRQNRDQWNRGYEGVNYYGVPGYYSGAYAPGYVNGGSSTSAYDNTGDDSAYYNDPQQLDSNAPYDQQDGNAPYSQPNDINRAAGYIQQLAPNFMRPDDSQQ